MSKLPLVPGAIVLSFNLLTLLTLLNFMFSIVVFLLFALNDHFATSAFPVPSI